MHTIVLILVILAAHFSLSAFVPSPAGQTHFYWPWAADMRPILAGIGGMPQEGGSIVTPLLAGIAGLCFLAAAAAMLGIIVPVHWWTALIIVGAAASTVLFILYISPFSFMPIILNLILVWGVVIQQWTVMRLLDT